MFSKSHIISTIVATIWGFAGGYLLWGILGADFINSHLGSATGMARETPDFLWLFIGCLVQACAFTGIYEKWANGSFSLVNGIKYGAWIGVLVGLGGELITYATGNMLDLTGSLGNAAIYIIFFAIMGLLTGLVYNKTTG